METKSRKCVSVVQLMEDDLHAFTSPQNRKKGLIKNAMIYAILPDRFKQNDSIEISLINNDEFEYNISNKVALSLGFQKIGTNEDKFVLLKKDFDVLIKTRSNNYFIE